MVIGFTGTRQGMTDAQRATVRSLLLQLRPELAIHGDCVGADEDFDALCAELTIPRSTLPRTAPDELRAHCERRGAHQAMPPRAHMVRNRDIAAHPVLIACPWNDVPIHRGSGTWATVRFAHRMGKRVYLVHPDGLCDAILGS